MRQPFLLNISEEICAKSTSIKKIFPANNADEIQTQITQNKHQRKICAKFSGICGNNYLSRK